PKPSGFQPRRRLMESVSTSPAAAVSHRHGIYTAGEKGVGNLNTRPAMASGQNTLLMILLFIAG
ncbi:hypothetical protein ACC771_17500, partial [Rhizobium ruizarguesonis]